MAVKVLELHHHGIRVGPSLSDVKKAYGFYHDVLGLDADQGRPTIPTIDESGVKGFTSSTFFSLMAPPKTPPEIRAKLNKAIVAAMQTPEVQAKLKLIFVEASTLDTKEMGEFVKAEAKLWGDVIRAANITVEQ